jgi:GMP synthase-like glutamine amidotransferase
MQLITQHFGGEVVAADHHEYGKAKQKDSLMALISSEQVKTHRMQLLQMIHVKCMPSNFTRKYTTL